MREPREFYFFQCRFFILLLLKEIFQLLLYNAEHFFENFLRSFVLRSTLSLITKMHSHEELFLF